MRHLKRAIQEEQGTSTFVQQLFLLGKSSEDTREEPLGEEENITSSCTIALCVLTISGKQFIHALLLSIIHPLLCVSSRFPDGGEWDAASPAISVCEHLFNFHSCFL